MSSDNIVREVLIISKEFFNDGVIYFIFFKQFTIAFIFLYSPSVRCIKNRFDPGGNSGNNGPASSWSYSCKSAISYPVFLNLVPKVLRKIFNKFTFAISRPVKIWECTLFFSQFYTGFIGSISKNLHNLVHGLKRILTIVLNIHFYQHISQTKNSESNSTIILSISFL